MCTLKERTIINVELPVFSNHKLASMLNSPPSFSDRQKNRITRWLQLFQQMLSKPLCICSIITNQATNIKHPNKVFPQIYKLFNKEYILLIFFKIAGGVFRWESENSGMESNYAKQTFLQEKTFCLQTGCFLKFNQIQP